MSKKTRKKSSTKPDKPPRKTPAKKPAAAKAARGGTKTSLKKTSLKKASIKAPAAKAGIKADNKTGKAVAKKSGQAAKTASIKESHKPASKQLKSNLSASPKPDPKPDPVSGLVEGAKAPAFRLPRDGGESVSLADYAGRKLVLFFYPRADTPGCTREAIDFTRLRDTFANQGTAVLGISADTVKAQESFRNKHQLSIPLVSDEQHEMLEAYGAWGEKSMYGRTFMGIIRTTVLIGADGRIAKIWRNVRVGGHADEVLDTVRGM